MNQDRVIWKSGHLVIGKSRTGIEAAGIQTLHSGHLEIEAPGNP
jgi:hypothetical protein